MANEVETKVKNDIEKTQKKVAKTKKDVSKVSSKVKEEISKTDNSKTTNKSSTKAAKTAKTDAKVAKKDSKKIEKSKEIKKSKKSDEKIKQIIEEQLVNLNKAKEIENDNIPKKSQNKKVKKLDEKEISEQIEKAKKMPKEQKKKIGKRILINLAILLSICTYCAFLNLGYLNIDGSKYITDLKAFSLGLIALTIMIFEYAYNKDSGRLALFGVEVLCTAIVTLILTYVYILHKDQFFIVIGIYSGLAFIYYAIKTITIKIKETKEWKKSISDVKEIMKEE